MTKGGFQVDKRIPVAVLIGFMIQALVFVWFFSGQISTLSLKIEFLEKQFALVAAQLVNVNQDTHRLTRVEAELKNLDRGLEEIKQLIRTQKN